MAVVASPLEHEVYLVMGIDEFEYDHVLGAFYSLRDAQKFCTQMMCESIYYDLWVEKHPVM